MKHELPAPRALPGDKADDPGLLARIETEHGSMSLRVPQARLDLYVGVHARGSRAVAEVADVRLNPERARMYGQKLFELVKSRAEELGIDTLVTTSGPDGSQAVTDVWNTEIGKPIGMDESFDGENYGRMIWLAKLAQD